MAKRRLNMELIRRVLQLRLDSGLSQREVARSLKIGKTTIVRYERLALNGGIKTYKEVELLSDTELAKRLGLTPGFEFSKKSLTPRKDKSLLPDCEYIKKELLKKNVTLALLWEEYKEEHPKGYGYSQFCEYYHRYKKTLPLSLRQEHKAGEKVFVDYAGTTFPIYDRKVNLKIMDAQIFVGVLGASCFTYAEATRSQQLLDFVMSHVRMFNYFDGVPQIIVPDNLKSGVTKANRYEPLVNKTYEKMCEHYGVAVIPARVRKPKDKAKAEQGVLMVSRWILASLRNQRFYSLQDLNESIETLLEKLNSKTMRIYQKSRQELFIELDKPALARLRQTAFVFSEWKYARVNIDYHVEFEKHFYSCPYTLVGKRVEIRATGSSVEIYDNKERVASHFKSSLKGGFSTNENHRPKSHKEHLDWTPERIINWAKSKGEETKNFMVELFKSYLHPEQGYRPALGVIRLGDKYGHDKLNKACKRALEIGSVKYQTVKNILDKNLQDLNTNTKKKEEELDSFRKDSNVRGKDYYN